MTIVAKGMASALAGVAFLASVGMSHAADVGAGVSAGGVNGGLGASVGGADGASGSAGVTISDANADVGVNLGGGTVVNSGTAASDSGAGIKTSSIKPDASTATSSTGRFNVSGMSAKEMARYKRRCVDILANRSSSDSDLVALCQAIQ